MSLALIKAVQERNLPEVKRQIEQLGANVNYFETSEYLGDKIIKTPLTIAIANLDFDIALYLLAKNAEIEGKGNYGERGAPTILTQVFRHEKITKLLMANHPDAIKLITELLKRTNNLNPSFSYSGFHSQAHFLVSQTGYWDQFARYKLFVMEAILKGDDGILDDIKNTRKVLTTPHDFENYIRNRLFTSSEAEQAYLGLRTSVDKELISKNDANRIQEMIAARIFTPIVLESFPKEMREALKFPPAMDLNNLFAKFRNILCPEENLPEICAANDNFKERFPDLIIRFDEIMGLQNPYHLKFLLTKAFNDNELLIRLAAQFQGDANKTNELALLLAQILLYKSNEIVHNENNEAVPLLTSDEQQRCMYLLTKIYSLTPEDERLIYMHREQKTCQLETQFMVNELASRVNGVEKQLIVMMGILRSMEAKLSDPTVNNSQQTNLVRPASPKLF